MARRRGGQTWSSAAPEGAVRVGFVVDAAGIRKRVLAVLDEILEEAQASRAYSDASYVDEDGVHHAKGGFWNDRHGRAADGITLQHVSDALRKLSDEGVLIDFDDADALLNQYQRTGEIPELALLVSLEGGGDALLRISPAPRREQAEESFEAGGMTFFRRSTDTYVARSAGCADQFVVYGAERWCSCGRGETCAELVALADHFRWARSLVDRLATDGDPDAELLRGAVRIAETFGLGTKRAAGKAGRFRDDVAAATFLIANEIYGNTLRSSRTVAQLCELLQSDVPGERSIRRYAHEPSVSATLNLMRTAAANVVKNLGIEPLAAAADLKAREIARSIVALLRTAERLRDSVAGSGEAA